MLIKGTGGEEMPDRMIAQHCSPTLAGLKTANLFSIRGRTKKELCAELRELNRRLAKKGVRAIPVRCNPELSLVYVYRPKALERDLSKHEAKRILCEKGYRIGTANNCIIQLIRRLKESKEFPHEIGLFLGYPPEDVRGFMEKETCTENCRGCWKVYGNCEQAKKTFAKYEHCTKVYCREIEKGRSLEKLTVAEGGH